MTYGAENATNFVFRSCRSIDRSLPCHARQINPPDLPNGANHGSSACKCLGGNIQLMLVMLASWLGKWRQFVLQASEAQGAVWPEQQPADAHDARLLARQMVPITGAVCSASI